MKIAFENLNTAQWTAGSIYLSNLLLAVRQAASGQDVRTAVVANADSPVSDDVRAAADEVIEVEAAKAPKSFQRLIRGLRHRVGWPVATPSRLGSILLARNFDVFFGAIGTGTNLLIPTLGWIPDFQHCRMPSMFSADENAFRNQAYQNVAAHATTVVLSSHDARTDFDAFAPDRASKAAVLHFVTPIPPLVFMTDPATVIARYHLPDKFFYLPNQLWRHKNIEVVIDAIALLKRRVKISVVWTGNTSDYRHPEYAASVLRKVAESNVREQFIMLGLVARLEVFSLARQAVAVLQPSRFEGWSTSVEECKSLGKGMIVTDLSVHREQAPPQSSYFDPDSAADLALKLEAVWRSTDPGPNRELELSARAAFPGRFASFGRAFLDIVDRTVSHQQVVP